MGAVSEGMNLGIKLGMDPQKLASIVNVSSGRCWSSDTYNPVPGIKEVPASNQYQGGMFFFLRICVIFFVKTKTKTKKTFFFCYVLGFVVDLMRKDLGLALTAAKGVNASTPLGSNVTQLYDMISQRGHGNKDFAFLYQFVKGTENDNTYGA